MCGTVFPSRITHAYMYVQYNTCVQQYKIFVYLGIYQILLLYIILVTRRTHFWDGWKWVVFLKTPCIFFRCRLYYIIMVFFFFFVFLIFWKIPKSARPRWSGATCFRILAGVKFKHSMWSGTYFGGCSRPIYYIIINERSRKYCNLMCTSHTIYIYIFPRRTPRWWLDEKLFVKKIIVWHNGDILIR